MRVLADTHLLVWSAISPERLSAAAQASLEDPQNEVIFSTVSIWETAIKHARGRPDFILEPSTLRLGLLDVGYRELLITSEHAIAVTHLPPLHGDPFDRLLVAQARVEGLVLLTADTTLARYPGVRLV